MPRVKTVKCLPFLWLAFTLNDWGDCGPVRWGWTEAQARLRAAMADECESD